MLHYFKLSLIFLFFFLLLAAVQTVEHRFQNFDDYLNVGYGNVPYSSNYK